jgi:hypothetical protein
MLEQTRTPIEVFSETDQQVPRVIKSQLSR